MLFRPSVALALVASAMALSMPAVLIPDAPYSVAAHLMEATIECPAGIAGKKGGIVLLVHGTGSTGPQSWAAGPYVNLLPDMGAGYDVCYVSLPDFSTGDVQRSSEYVAYGVQYLAPKSATGRVSIIGHSQGGGVNPQHALTYWPSIQKLVSGYIALAADFQGTLLFNTQANEAQDGSNYMKQQNSPLPGSGARALVPTTSIYTYTDDIVQPQLVDSTSVLPGAGNHAIQDLDVCGPSAVAEHFTLIMSPQAFGLVFAALEHGSPVDLSKFDKAYCTYTKGNMLTNSTAVAGFADGVVADSNQNGDAQKIEKEPLLQASLTIPFNVFPLNLN
ncbi:hypothetical protein RQP46_006291 [Phenoliferia psychrophenolica]